MNDIVYCSRRFQTKNELTDELQHHFHELSRLLSDVKNKIFGDHCGQLTERRTSRYM